MENVVLYQAAASTTGATTHTQKKDQGQHERQYLNMVFSRTRLSRLMGRYKTTACRLRLPCKDSIYLADRLTPRAQGAYRLKRNGYEGLKFCRKCTRTQLSSKQFSNLIGKLITDRSTETKVKWMAHPAPIDLSNTSDWFM